MKARTKKISLLIAVGTMLSSGIFAQLPANFKPHGTNSSDVVTAQEDTDSIMVGATMRYIVQPDAAANPSYTWPAMGGTLSSQFNWTVDAAVGTINGAPDTDNDVTITVNSSAGSGNIQVQEQLGTCAGSTVTIPVQVIDEPTADFTLGTNTICQSDTVGGYDVELSLTTATEGNRVTYAIQFDGPTTSDLYSTTATTVNEGTYTITIPEGSFSDGPGNYVVSFTVIRDHISVKCGVAGTSTTATHTVTINRTPNTGTIYHVPNL